jgi:hypothetical protein
MTSSLKLGEREGYTTTYMKFNRDARQPTSNKTSRMATDCYSEACLRWIETQTESEFIFQTSNGTKISIDIW